MSEWKLVPVEPTEGMIVRGEEAFCTTHRHPYGVYEQMLASAPDPAQDEALVGTVAKIISGAPFPSKQSLAKTRAILAALKGGA